MSEKRGSQDQTQYDDELVDFDLVTQYAKAGLKDPELIALKMGVPYSIFEMCLDDVELAIKRGHADLALEQVTAIRQNAMDGDFQAQKYILQNVDDSYSDRKETVNKYEFDASTLPKLDDMFHKGLENLPEKIIEGEHKEIE